MRRAARSSLNAYDEVMIEPDKEFTPASRGERLLEEFKRRRLWAGQFRFSTIVWLTIAAATIASLPRFFGFDPIVFFQIGGFLACFFAPLTVLVINGFFPTFSKQQRMRVSLGLFVVFLVGAVFVWPYLAGEVTVDEWIVYLISLAIGWLLQAIAIWGIWRVVFVRR